MRKGSCHLDFVRCKDFGHGESSTRRRLPSFFAPTDVPPDFLQFKPSPTGVPDALRIARCLRDSAIANLRQGVISMNALLKQAMMVTLLGTAVAANAQYSSPGSTTSPSSGTAATEA